MKLLLDTHIWIWAGENPDKLNRRVRRELEEPGNELYLSPVSIWEAHHLGKRKRIHTREGFSRWLDTALKRLPVREPPLRLRLRLKFRVSRLRKPIWEMCSWPPQPQLPV